MKTIKILFLCCCLIMPVQTNAQLLKGIITGVTAYNSSLNFPGPKRPWQ